MVDLMQFELFSRLQTARLGYYEKFSIESTPIDQPFSGPGDAAFQLFVKPFAQLLVCAIIVPAAVIDSLVCLAGFGSDEDESNFYQAARSFVGIFYMAVHAVIDPLWELYVFAMRCGASLFPEAGPGPSSQAELPPFNLEVPVYGGVSLMS